MNFFRRLAPSYTPENIMHQGDILVLREKILQAIMVFFTIAGLPVMVTIAVVGIGAESDSVNLVYYGVYLLFLSMTIARGAPYTIRAHILTSIAYLLSVVQVFENGELSDLRAYLIAYTALSAVFFGYRTTIWSLSLGLLTIAGFGIYGTTVPEPAVAVLANIRNGTSWMVIGGAYLLLGGIIAGSISFLVNGLGTHLEQRADLADRLEYERDSLESRIDERTVSLTRSMAQLHAAADISHTIGALTDPETLLQQVAELIKDRFHLYYVGIFLIDGSRQNAVLRAGTGEAGIKMISQGHQLAVGGGSMIGWAVSNRKARIALDVGAEAVRFNNPHLPRTRSEMALPIVTHDQVLGAITIQSDQANAFDENDITILESVANSLGIALENDRLYHETRQSLEEIRALNRDYLQRAWAETIDVYGDLSYDFVNKTAFEPNQKAETNLVEVPMMLRDEVIGTITLEMDRTHLNEEETSFVENVTTQTAIALENARLLHETERRALQEQKLNELASRFSRALSIDEIIRAAVQEFGQLPSVAEVSVQINPTAQQAQPANGGPARPGSNGKEHHG